MFLLAVCCNAVEVHECFRSFYFSSPNYFIIILQTFVGVEARGICLPNFTFPYIKYLQKAALNIIRFHNYQKSCAFS